MKILLSLIAIVMFTKECDQSHSEESKTPNLSEQQQNDIIVSYETSTRGFFEKIWVSKEAISVTNDRNLKEKRTFEISKDQWNEITDILKSIDVSTLPELKSPTKDRESDGALFATLTVEQNGMETKTDSFDHGNPPEAISKLVNKVLSLKEMVQKQ